MNPDWDGIMRAKSRIYYSTSDVAEKLAVLYQEVAELQQRVQALEIATNTASE